MDDAADFGQNREGVRVPLEEHLVRLHRRAVLKQDLGAVDDRIALTLAALLVEHRDDAIAVHGDQLALGIADGCNTEKLDEAPGLGILLRLFARPGCRTADVERSHRELRSGFADGLRRDDAHRLAALDQPAGREIAAVAKLADAALRFARQYRTDLHALDSGGLNGSRQLFGNLVVHTDDHVALVIELVFESHAADDTIA